jgi:hypothetical protein
MYPVTWMNPITLLTSIQCQKGDNTKCWKFALMLWQVQCQTGDKMKCWIIVLMLCFRWRCWIPYQVLSMPLEWSTASPATTTRQREWRRCLSKSVVSHSVCQSISLIINQSIDN